MMQAREPAGYPWLGSNDTSVIVSAGRLTADKDFGTLIRAFAVVYQERPLQLVILGEGSDRTMLRDLSAQLGVADAVHLPGFVSNPFVVMASSQLFVLSSTCEGFPNVLIEAMACGTPNVVARLRHYEEILMDRESALFVDPTPEGVAAGIIEILGDRGLADLLRSNGSKIVGEKAELSREAARVSEIYQRLHAEPPGRPLPFFVRMAAKTVLCGLVIRKGLKLAFAGGIERHG